MALFLTPLPSLSYFCTFLYQDFKLQLIYSISQLWRRFCVYFLLHPLFHLFFKSSFYSDQPEELHLIIHWKICLLGTFQSFRWHWLDSNDMMKDLSFILQLCPQLLSLVSQVLFLRVHRSHLLNLFSQAIFCMRFFFFSEYFQASFCFHYHFLKFSPSSCLASGQGRIILPWITPLHESLYFSKDIKWFYFYFLLQTLCSLFKYLLQCSRKSIPAIFHQK